MEHTNETHCNQCPNQCAKEHLSCFKGRAYFGIPEDSPADTCLLSDRLIRCGQKAEKLSAQLLEFGMEEQMMFNTFSADKQKQLTALLQEMELLWTKDFNL